MECRRTTKRKENPAMSNCGDNALGTWTITMEGGPALWDNVLSTLDYATASTQPGLPMSAASTE